MKYWNGILFYYFEIYVKYFKLYGLNGELKFKSLSYLGS